MFFGFIDFIKCPTQALVNMTDIILRNVTAVGSVLTNAAVLNCNVTNPCTGFVFENVTFYNDSYVPWDTLYYCRNVFGEFNDCDPNPHCINNDSYT